MVRDESDGDNDTQQAPPTVNVQHTLRVEPERDNDIEQDPPTINVQHAVRVEPEEEDVNAGIYVLRPRRIVIRSPSKSSYSLLTTPCASSIDSAGLSVIMERDLPNQPPIPPIIRLRKRQKKPQGTKLKILVFLWILFMIFDAAQNAPIPDNGEMRDKYTMNKDENTTTKDENTTNKDENTTNTDGHNANTENTDSNLPTTGSDVSGTTGASSTGAAPGVFSSLTDDFKLLG
ncbi:uncharacterized protein LOC135087023 [Ostrinia nubilalis]|uniref:uncharacterized protein LOC135087023 n=1 Tax=Ostrinia nubilalis TaxID=29057 RepID=UPI0030823E1B